jgi:CrcB protein
VSWLLISLGGAVGTALRYGLTLAVGALVGPGFPWGTFAANLVGSFVLSLVAELGLGREILGTDARLVLGVGVLGGFTTYSTFNLETLRLLQDDAYGRAAGYVVATLGVCLIGGMVGLWVARSFKTP